jgi:hypothetical protein
MAVMVHLIHNLPHIQVLAVGAQAKAELLAVQELEAMAASAD